MSNASERGRRGTQNPNSETSAEDEFAPHFEALYARRPLRHPELREARSALAGNRADLAERYARGFLKKHPGNVDALNLLGEAALDRERESEAVALLSECVTRAPGFELARYNYARALHRMNRPAQALEQVEKLLARDPRNPLFCDVKLVALKSMGRHADALACVRAVAQAYPGSAKVLVSYAQTLRDMGFREEAISVYRKAIALSPALGRAWSGLANFRNYEFCQDEVARIQAQLARSGLEAADRVHLLFALGKALGDLGRYAESFDAYARANAMRRIGTSSESEGRSVFSRASKAVFTEEFFRARAGSGVPSRAPIFVLGMQRAGSTLIEQILASHPQIEGAGELAHMRFLARRLEGESRARKGVDFPALLAELEAGVFRALAEEYLHSTIVRRPLGRPFFVDKEPFNFGLVGMIHLLLPNARIIDVRRHPLGCCFSNFTTFFGHELSHTFRLDSLGRFYAEYVELMAHYDRVLPGRVYRVFYERLVAEPESEIRRLLDYIDLPFDSACLAFHTNARALNSTSSEQVRTPLYREALDHWRRYEPWLDPLKKALGPVLTAYPDVPAFDP